MLTRLALLALVSTSLTAHAAPAPRVQVAGAGNFAGVYSQTSDAIGDDGSPGTNSVDVTKLTDVKDGYFVSVSVVAPGISLCDISGRATLSADGKSLLAKADGSCRLSVTKENNRLQIQSSHCQEWCGAGAAPEGIIDDKGRAIGFERTGDSGPMTSTMCAQGGC